MFRRSRFVSLLFVVLLAGLTPVHAQEADSLSPDNRHFQFVAFGDSLMDAGTYSPIAKLLFDGGRFTTNPGHIFAQDVASNYGDRLTPAFVGGLGIPLFPAGGLDYAQGGSRVKLQPGTGHASSGTPNAVFAAATTIPIKDQVAAYLCAHKKFRPNQIVLIDGGSDDIFFNLQAAQTAGTPAAQQAAADAIAQAAVDLVDILGTLFANGAKHVVLMNVPDIGVTPLGISSPDHGQSLTELARLFNATLIDTLQQTNLINQVILVDIFTELDEVLANYQANGFLVSNTAIACNLQAQVARATELNLPDPTAFAEALFCSPQTLTVQHADQTFMFADTLHPTTHLGAVFAQFLEDRLLSNGLGR